MEQPIKIDNLMLSVLDDDALMRQIQSIHSSHSHEVDVKPIIHIIEDIIYRSSPDINIDIQDATLEDDAKIVGFDGIQEASAYIIRKISCELSYKCSSGENAHATTMLIFNLLSNYSWDAKLVIALAAFSVNCGELWLVVYPDYTNRLTKSISILKQVPNINKHGGLHKSWFDAINKLSIAVLEVTRSIVDEFKCLPAPNAPPTLTAMANFPTAVYWTIRSMVAGASRIASMSYEDNTSTAEASEFLSLAQKVYDIRSGLKKQERIYHQLLNSRHPNDMEIYKRYISKTDQFSVLIRQRIQLLFDTVLVRLFKSAHTDNQKILKELIYAKDDILPLVEGTTKTRVGIEVLSTKTVLLLISDLDIRHEEIVILSQYYNEMKLNPNLHYEIVWLPIIDQMTPCTESDELEFEKLLSMMPWYAAHHPSLLDPEVVRYIREEWHFEKNPLLVALDPLAKVVCPNALHMIRIWGNLAYPFTSLRQESLWKEETWRLELLVNKIDTKILERVVQGKYICLYGGGDIEWIRNFTTAAEEVTQLVGIPLEMVYVGESNAERVISINEVISKENLSHCLPNPTFIWYFWARLESILYTNMGYVESIQNDRITQELLTVVSSDRRKEGWAVGCRGFYENTKSKGYPLLTILTDFESREDKARERGFVPALEYYLLDMPQHYQKRRVETYQVLRRLFEMTHTDNLQILKALLYTPTKDEMLPLYDGTAKEKVGVEVLRRKTVLLLITDLDILEDEITMFSVLHQETKFHPMIHYEIVWLPIVDRTTPWTKSHQLKFDRLLSLMPWYTVNHPLHLDPEVVRYIKDMWHFTKDPILVVLDPQAKVVHYNALHMMRIWGNLAYPFTTFREKSFWKEEDWKLELIVDSIDFLISEWIDEEKLICLYGGDDIAWIRKFTTTAKEVARSANIPLEMVYIGKNRAIESVRSINEAIRKEELSYFLPDVICCWYFWARIESMYFSKTQHSIKFENDRILQELVKILTFDSKERRWAIFSSGSNEITTAKGDMILQSLEEFDNWEYDALERGFVTALEDNMKQLHA